MTCLASVLCRSAKLTSHSKSGYSIKIMWTGQGGSVRILPGISPLPLWGGSEMTLINVIRVFARGRWMIQVWQIKISMCGIRKVHFRSETEKKSRYTDELN